MSLNAPLFYVIPEETVQVAKAAFPKGNRSILLRDTFGQLFQIPTSSTSSPIPVSPAKTQPGSR